MIKWFKSTFPDTTEFIRNFFKTMNNKAEGHSLRKWISVGCFWILAKICVMYTDNTNVVSVATVISSLITALIITNTVGNYQEKKLDKLPNIPTDAGAGQS